eukprot:5026413-Pyramimonas_sp.AAC.1
MSASLSGGSPRSETPRTGPLGFFRARRPRGPQKGLVRVLVRFLFLPPPRRARGKVSVVF